MPNPTADLFARAFGAVPKIHAAAHGRVNLIGEHTDYNGGFVLPMLIPQATDVWLTPTAGDLVRVFSPDVTPNAGAYRLGAEDGVDKAAWWKYVAGITKLLAADDNKVSGFDLAVRSAVPVGSGLSSSAALEVAVLRALRDAFDLAVSDIDIAVLGRRVENEFVGANVGIMDQLVCSIGRTDAAVLIDARSLESTLVPLPPGIEIAVINSNVPHDHSKGSYNDRVRECNAAVAAFGVTSLRDCGLADLPRIDALPDPLNRRARHIVTENDRVHRLVAAFAAGMTEQYGPLLAGSHDSQRDDFEVSIPAVDALVAAAAAHPECLGARLTGGGFGGAILALCPTGRAASIAAFAADRYHSATGNTATILVP